MDSDRIKWNTRYESEDSFLGERPSPFLAREIERIKALVPGLAALDIACGEGRNSLFLAQHGFRVTGLDISDRGLEKGEKRALALGLDVEFRRVDLDDCIIQGTFDLILNFNFLLRELIPSEIAALKTGGLLLFDTIMVSEQLLQSHKPSYLLQPGELPRLFGAFQGEILFSEESMSGEMPTARILFRKSPGFYEPIGFQ
ncbi:MAG: class I SAM-dependent methyltransferase [Desulfuromonadaceae bacterium]|nr:class I SAM-dependent methyltransferase [Desulfuromonadaceae bacterium]